MAPNLRSRQDIGPGLLLHQPSPPSLSHVLDLLLHLCPPPSHPPVRERLYAMSWPYRVMPSVSHGLRDYGGAEAGECKRGLCGGAACGILVHQHHFLPATGKWPIAHGSKMGGLWEPDDRLRP